MKNRKTIEKIMKSKTQCMINCKSKSIWYSTHMVVYVGAHILKSMFLFFHSIHWSVFLSKSNVTWLYAKKKRWKYWNHRGSTYRLWFHQLINRDFLCMRPINRWMLEVQTSDFFIPRFSIFLGLFGFFGHLRYNLFLHDSVYFLFFLVIGYFSITEKMRKSLLWKGLFE